MELSYNLDEIDFKAGKSMIVPYVKLKVPIDSFVSIIKEIIVGPTPEIDLSVSSIYGITHKYGLENIQILKSDIPYRYW